MLRRLTLLLCLLLLQGVAFAQTCTTTLDPGATLSTALSAAAGGDTICLNSGSYGTQVIDNIQKASIVTVRSTTGVGASMSLQVSRLQNVTFDSLTLSFSFVNDSNNTPRSLNLSFLNMTHTAAFHARIEGVTTSRNWVFDGGTMNDTPQSTFEGRFQVCCSSSGATTGITIKNYTISNTTGCGGPLTDTTKSDGIQVGASGVTVGPGNTFRDLRQCGTGVHVDAIQLLGGSSNVTITGNYFTLNTINLGVYDGGSNFTITHNVFDTPGDVLQNLQLNLTNTTFQHNTFIDTLAAVGAKSTSPPVTGFTWKDNLHQNSQIIDSGDQPGCQSSCIYDFNMFSSVGQSRGTNVVIGTATFVGGANPTTHAGHALATGSVGENAASDGLDIGIIVSGGTPPSAPTNLRITRAAR